MFCKNCGSALSDQTAFCPNCGTKVQANAQQPRPVQQNNYPQQPAPAPATDLRSALNLNNDTTALFSYVAAGCSAVAAILWGFVGRGGDNGKSLYELYIEPYHMTAFTVLIIMALALSAVILVLPQLGVLNANILSKKAAALTATITSVAANTFAFFFVHGYRSKYPNVDLGDMNAMTFLFFILAWFGLILTLVVLAKSYKAKK